jgi:hypothetical protein
MIPKIDHYIILHSLYLFLIITTMGCILCLFFFFYSYVHTMFGLFLPPSSHPLPFPYPLLCLFLGLLSHIHRTWIYYCYISLVTLTSNIWSPELLQVHKMGNLWLCMNQRLVSLIPLPFPKYFINLRSFCQI